MRFYYFFTRGNTNSCNPLAMQIFKGKSTQFVEVQTNWSYRTGSKNRKSSASDDMHDRIQWHTRVLVN